MNKKNEINQVRKQLSKVNTRLEVLCDKMNKEYNSCIQELLALSTVLSNLEHGFTDTNEILLKK